MLKKRKFVFLYVPVSCLDIVFPGSGLPYKDRAPHKATQSIFFFCIKQGTKRVDLCRIQFFSKRSILSWRSFVWIPGFHENLSWSVLISQTGQFFYCLKPLKWLNKFKAIAKSYHTRWSVCVRLRLLCFLLSCKACTSLEPSSLW